MDYSKAFRALEERQAHSIIDHPPDISGHEVVQHSVSNNKPTLSVFRTLYLLNKL